MNFNFSMSFGGGAAGRDTSGISGVSGASSQGWLTQLLGGGRTKSGLRVNADTAMAISAVYRCLLIKSGTVGMLPLTLYKRKGSDDREKAVDHPLFKLTKTSPGRQCTAFNWKRTSQANLEMRGNAFSLIDRDGAGRVAAMRTVPAHVVTCRQSKATGELFYDTPDEQGIPARRMLHLRGFSWDGLVGMSTLELARETMGLALSTESAGAEAFGKGAIPPVIISVKGNPDPVQRKKYRDDWVELYQGQRYAPAIVGEMVKAEALNLNLEDMQFLQSRKFQVVEVCRWFGVPPHKVYELDRATFSNIEHQGIEWLQDSIDPILVNWEAEMNMSLLTRSEQDEYYFEFDRVALLRTDVKTRYEAYKLGREIGDLSVDEIRRFENRSSVPGGDTRIEPMNMRPLGSAAEAGANPGPKP
jgi:HK97 family phage portal protein